MKQREKKLYKKRGKEREKEAKRRKYKYIEKR